MVQHLLQLTLDPSGAGTDGLEALLSATGRSYLEPDNKAWTQVEDAWEKINEVPTHLLLWPGQKNDEIITFAQERGIECRQVTDFLHRLWNNQRVFSLPEPYVMLNGRPLLWHLLQAGGYEPSLLWPGAEGEKWIGIQGLGQCWVVPEAWLNAAGATYLGQREASEEAYWELAANKVAFYRSRFRFLGFLDRWPQPALEHMACQQVIQAYEYGVSWTDIRRALKSWGVEEKRARWDIDEMGPGAGADGEELPASPAYDLEDWRAG